MDSNGIQFSGAGVADWQVRSDIPQWETQEGLQKGLTVTANQKPQMPHQTPGVRLVCKTSTSLMTGGFLIANRH